MDLALTVAAVLPAIVLCVYVFRKDKVEKEPISLLILLFFAGMFSCLPAAFLETVLTKVLAILFKPFTMTNAYGEQVMNGFVQHVYNFFEYFFIVALVEEALKFLVLYLCTRKEDDFNCLFDGMIYAVFVSLGFATFENIFYVMEYGMQNAIMRGILSVPAHMFFAVLMGYYYTFWNVECKIVKMEKQLRVDRVFPQNAKYYIPGKNKRNMLLVPVLAHGLYDFCCTAGTVVSLVVFIAFVAYLYVSCFKKIRRMSEDDRYVSSCAKGVLIRKHPELEDYINEHF